MAEGSWQPVLADLQMLALAEQALAAERERVEHERDHSAALRAFRRFPMRR